MAISGAKILPGRLPCNIAPTISTPLATDSPATPPELTKDIVNCAAGSPIDWAASIPTLAPISCNLASEKPRP